APSAVAAIWGVHRRPRPAGKDGKTTGRLYLRFQEPAPAFHRRISLVLPGQGNDSRSHRKKARYSASCHARAIVSSRSAHGNRGQEAGGYYIPVPIPRNRTPPANGGNG